jgi:hypothetical protein
MVEKSRGTGTKRVARAGLPAEPAASAMPPVVAVAAPRSPPSSRGTPYRMAGGQVEKRKRDPLPALSFLKGSDLWTIYQRLAALEKDLRQIQPRLELKPLKLANQILVVTAGSPAVAARLRQFEPSLIEGLRARGWLVGRIRFRPIAVHDEPKPPAPRIKQPVSQAVLQRLQTLDDSGMNPELQAALGSFVRRQKGYLES